MRASATVLELPKSFELAQNYPNPFNPTTNFSFTLAQAGTVSLEVYNILGQKIRTIVENELLEPGVYDGSYQWDATDDAGNVVSGGIYYYVFTVKENNFRKVRKMVFLK
jgi:flagellar hook assembly protein FlgD